MEFGNSAAAPWGSKRRRAQEEYERMLEGRESEVRYK